MRWRVGEHNKKKASSLSFIVPFHHQCLASSLPFPSLSFFLTEEHVLTDYVRVPACSFLFLLRASILLLVVVLLLLLLFCITFLFLFSFSSFFFALSSCGKDPREMCVCVCTWNVLHAVVHSPPVSLSFGVHSFNYW